MQIRVRRSVSVAGSLRDGTTAPSCLCCRPFVPAPFFTFIKRWRSVTSRPTWSQPAKANQPVVSVVEANVVGLAPLPRLSLAQATRISERGKRRCDLPWGKGADRRHLNLQCLPIDPTSFHRLCGIAGVRLLLARCGGRPTGSSVQCQGLTSKIRTQAPVGLRQGCQGSAARSDERDGASAMKAPLSVRGSS